MKYVSTLIAVQDMERSKRFYHDVLGLNVVSDFGANAVLDGGIALQTLDSWREFIGRQDVAFSHHAGELYFEEADMDRFLARLQSFEIFYVHPPMEHRWGQRVVRFYDPDRHIVEVGEDMVMVVRRFADSGMAPEAVARRMDVPLDYIQSCLDPRRPAE